LSATAAGVTLAIGAMVELRSGQLFTNQYRRRGTIIELLYRRHHFLFPSTAMDVLA
jgi:hypothetical protein